MNQITVKMHKANDIQVNNQQPFTANTKKMIQWLAYQDFNMICFQFDVRLFSSAADKMRKREYNKFMNRVNKIAGELGLTVGLVENQIINGVTFPHHYTAVLVR